MDFSFICKYCDQLYEITLSQEIKELILKIKTNEKIDMAQIQDTKNSIENKMLNQSPILTENQTNLNINDINGIDMCFVNVDRISILEIISNLDLILENKICEKCYKNLAEINEKEIEKLNKEIAKVNSTTNLIKKEISLNSDNIIGEYSKTSKFDDLKSQEEATKKLNQDNNILQDELNENIEKLKKINKDEEDVLNKINIVRLALLSTSKDYELEKSIQQKYQFEQVTLLNNNILETLFDIQIGEKYGVINGCKMIFKNYSSFSEIYSGWGHILLLTNIINLKVKKILNISQIKDPYKIYNLGDYSYIYNSIDKNKYLFYESNNSLNENSKAKELNQSMLQYLQILKDIDDKIKKVNVNTCELNNFNINSTSINYNHIELNINYDDYEWVLCMKSLLILLKYYIKVITYHENEELKKIIENNNKS